MLLAMGLHNSSHQGKFKSNILDFPIIKERLWNHSICHYTSASAYTKSFLHCQVQNAFSLVVDLDTKVKNIDLF